MSKPKVEFTSEFKWFYRITKPTPKWLVQYVMNRVEIIAEDPNPPVLEFKEQLPAKKYLTFGEPNE